LLRLTILPPRCTPLFPYTTLFRSRRRTGRPHRGAGGRRSAGASRVAGPACPRVGLGSAGRRGADLVLPGDPAPDRGRRGGAGVRSEEHTSELQSRENLVCRLLLE